MNKMTFPRFTTAKLFVPALLLLLVCTCTIQAQNRPLTGSGKIAEQTYPLNGFDKLHLENLAGRVEVEIGRPFSVSIAIDDNLQPLLQTGVLNGVLKVALKGNERNKLYIENTGIVVKISMPEISVLEHTGNSQLTVNGITGRYFRIKNTGNGNARVTGAIDELDIIKTGNGDINARYLVAKMVKLTTEGNGDVTINTNARFTASLSGNGNVTNYGTGTAAASQVTGNGNIRYEPGKQKVTVKITEVKNMAGKWTGALSYLDYSSNTKETIPCNLDAEVWEKERKIKLNFIYPKEMKYNSSSIFALNTAGDRFGNADITEKNILPGGGIKIVTEEKGEDDRKPATIKHTIVLTEKTFTITKTVRFDGEEQFFQRNEYAWTR